MNEENAIPDTKLVSILITTIFIVASALYPVLANALLLGSFKWKNGLTLPFQKPWLITWGVFSGYVLCSIPLLFTTKCFKNDKTVTWHLFRACALPACCMVVSTVFQIYSLIYLSPSVWKSVQFFGLIFTTLITSGSEQSHSILLEWTALLIIFIGVMLSGTSALFADRYQDNDPSDTLYAIIFMLFAELIKAGQTKIEEIMLHEILTSSYVIMVCEGAWGWFLTTCVGLPFVHISTPTSPILVYENTYESLQMFGMSSNLPIMFVFIAVIVGIYGYIGVIVISHLSARKRNEFESISPIVVWIFSICAHYLTNNTNVGESAKLFSIPQVCGFIISIIGVAIYDQKIQLPWIIYEQVPDENELSDVPSENEETATDVTLKTL
ncbi:hypothetical protein TVAG_310040 [Trichomonas vaginalis G3]|uniref:EamA domain-containing protein n=1 Tax=Trichomonas vaginalis (strain ATCC PRA-98 / G3) TaxID=412133 RepID=A2EKS0_TRIV3|nr:negative regulation of mitochondrial outer membrane permeabilization protein [Trichomonas vaginalis G3]EAY06717.1 hypothetical protein TVAG_310040 [Trichomonas vaginalis G3]KAI5500989.1 negative regulation of mitochondrial outer membrane permeabilization protein [Trichomonas vaginalis G3]|eukprot:XP_001318940.1 hypothetical protein [Trichomonas vaginalis G3]